MASVGGSTPKQYYGIKGVDSYSNPLLHDGQMIHAVNVVSYPFGGKSKRTGYTQIFTNPDSMQVNSLFSFPNIGDDPTKLNLYRASGSSIYYSLQGTADWALAGNGTISNGAHFGQAILNNVLIGGDGFGSTRHTSDGTSFTNTTLAPIAPFFEEYQGRIYAAGTSSTVVYSTTNDATNWNLSGTSDSSSFPIPGAGKLNAVFKTADTLILTKTSGIMNKWDGYSRIDMATSYGPSSPYAIGKAEGARFLTNQYGQYYFAGANPQLISNPIQRQFYNPLNTGIAGTAFPTISGECHIYDYLTSVGTIQDDFTKRTIPNAIIKYDYQKNEYMNWSFANKPTAFHSYKDTSGVQQLIFGDTSGQCYQLDNSLTDNGQPITAEMVFVFTYGIPGFEKKWNWLRMFFNPGCEAKVQIAATNIYEYSRLQWRDVGDCSSGVVEYRFPDNPKSRLLFMRIYESSTNSRFSYYGHEIQAEVNTVP